MSDYKAVNVSNKVKVDTNSDLFKFFVALSLVSMAINIAAGRRVIEKSNDLRRQQLEVAKQQYSLDSLRYYAPQKQK